MACFHPIEAWDLTVDFAQDPERVISFRSPSADDRQKYIRQGRLLQLPCRKCVGCRLSKSREWANRAIMEEIYHQESWFLTLTYDDEHLPRSFPVDESTGEILSVHGTLVKRHVQDFLKRLRFHTGQKFRYFVAGEYGSQMYRPHYHFLLFGLRLNDLSVISHNFAGQSYYVSDIITKCWPDGVHILGPVTWQSASYVAQYTMKKATHGFDRSFYRKAAIQPEYQSMSLKPGIGYQYYVDHPDLFDYSYFNVSTPQGGRRVYPPEYFKRIFKSSNPDAYLKRSLASRKEAEINSHLKLLLTDKDYYDILKDDERRAFTTLSTLTRDDI